MSNKLFITITHPGSDLVEMGLILNKLTHWNRLQIERYFENPSEIEVELDELDYRMVLTGLKQYCPNSDYTILDIVEKRNNKLKQLGI